MFLLLWLADTRGRNVPSPVANESALFTESQIVSILTSDAFSLADSAVQIDSHSDTDLIVGYEAGSGMTAAISASDTVTATDQVPAVGPTATDTITATDRSTAPTQADVISFVDTAVSGVIVSQAQPVVFVDSARVGVVTADSVTATDNAFAPTSPDIANAADSASVTASVMATDSRVAIDVVSQIILLAPDSAEGLDNAIWPAGPELVTATEAIGDRTIVIFDSALLAEGIGDRSFTQGDQANGTDAVILARTLDDTASVTDLGVAGPVAVETGTATDSAAHGTSIFDFWTHTDTASVTTAVISAAEAVSALDAGSPGATIQVSESALFSDSAAAARAVTAADSASATEAFTDRDLVAIDFFFLDEAQTLPSVAGIATDVFLLVESISPNAAVIAADTATGGDSSFQTRAITAGDTASAYEYITGIARLITDFSALTDTAAVTSASIETVTDGFQGTDSGSAGYSPIAVEAVAFSDAAAVIQSVTASDAFTATDAIGDASKTVQDFLVVQDSALVGNVLFPDIGDSFAFSDQALPGGNISVVESISVGDVSLVTVLPTAPDAITASDLVSLTQENLEFFTASESLVIGVITSDTATASEVVLIPSPVSDSIVTTENATPGRPVIETAVFADFAVPDASISAIEQVVATDQAIPAGAIPTASESVAFQDIASVSVSIMANENFLASEDFTYPSINRFDFDTITLTDSAFVVVVLTPAVDTILARTGAIGVPAGSLFLTSLSPSIPGRG